MVILLLKKLEIKIDNILLSDFKQFVIQKRLVVQSKNLKTFYVPHLKMKLLPKKSYQTFYNIIERNTTMEKLSIDERDKIKEEFLRGNFQAKNVVTDLDCWIVFFFYFYFFLKYLFTF